MNYQQAEKLKLTTPICKFKYAWLVEPDTKFDAPVFKVIALIPAAEATAIEQQLEELLERFKLQLKTAEPNRKYKLASPAFEYTEEDGEPVFALKMKRKASGISKSGQPYTSSVALFDSQGKPITNTAPLSKMGAGTTGRLTFIAQPYNSPFGVGISVKVLAAQIINFVPYGGGSDSHGFTPVENGWTEEESEAEAVPFDSSAQVKDTGDFGDF
jgi:hypothetical protein